MIWFAPLACMALGHEFPRPTVVSLFTATLPTAYVTTQEAGHAEELAVQSSVTATLLLWYWPFTYDIIRLCRAAISTQLDDTDNSFAGQRYGGSIRISLNSSEILVRWPRPRLPCACDYHQIGLLQRTACWTTTAPEFCNSTRPWDFYMMCVCRGFLLKRLTSLFTYTTDQWPC